MPAPQPDVWSASTAVEEIVFLRVEYEAGADGWCNE